MKRLFLALSLMLAASLPARAARTTTFTLDNGLQIVVLEDHRAPVVVHMVWYRVGAADEPPGKSGIAHFLEHLMFKGTDTLGPGELSKIVTRNGGSDNAFTSWDYTAYFQRVAADRLELMMRMEADRMRNLRMTRDDVETERQVVLEERAQRTDSQPSVLFREQRRAAQYLNSPYGIPVVGWRREVERLSREDAYAFYQRFYAPNNAVLVVAGDVDPDHVLALARKYYGPLAPTPGLTARHRPQEPPQLAERRLTFRDPRIAQPFIVRSYLAPERDSGDQRAAARLTMLAELLGGDGATSVLGQKLVFGSRKALFVNAGYDGVSLDDTTFSLVIVPTPGTSMQEAEEALDKAVAEFIDEGVDPDQLARVKMQLRATRIYDEDDVESLARDYGTALTSGLTEKDVQAWPALLQQITADEVIAAAKEVFDRHKAVTGWAMPAAMEDGQ